MRRKSDLSGSLGAMTGAAMAIATIAIATPPQKAERGERRAKLRSAAQARPACCRAAPSVVGLIGSVGFGVALIDIGSSDPARR